MLRKTQSQTIDKAETNRLYSGAITIEEKRPQYRLGSFPNTTWTSGDLYPRGSLRASVVGNLTGEW